MKAPILKKLHIISSSGAFPLGVVGVVGTVGVVGVVDGVGVVGVVDVRIVLGALIDTLSLESESVRSPPTGEDLLLQTISQVRSLDSLLEGLTA